jgi:hypothetical protein
MLIKHKFEPDGHFYHVFGEFVLATSDVIELNGMSDFNQVPSKNLAHAALRGTMLHSMVEEAETGLKSPYTEFDGAEAHTEAKERLEAYFRFKEHHSVRLAGPMERTMVYRHMGTESLVGVTPDLYGYVSCSCKALYCPLRGLESALSVIDMKTCHRQYGEKLKQLRLKWWAQTQSQVEALEADDELWGQIKHPTCIERIVLHLHPECGKIRGGAATGFEIHRFTEDGQFLWDSMLRVAKEKLAHGYKINRPKTNEVPLEIGNRNYEPPTDCIF